MNLFRSFPNEGVDYLTNRAQTRMGKEVFKSPRLSPRAGNAAHCAGTAVRCGLLNRAGFPGAAAGAAERRPSISRDRWEVSTDCEPVPGIRAEKEVSRPVPYTALPAGPSGEVRPIP